MDMVVILEFRQGEEVHPVVLSLIDEYLKVLLQFLIDPLRLSVPLWVIGCGGRYLNPEYAVQLLSELCYELRTSVRDYLAGYAVEFPNVLDEQSDRACCRQSGECRYEMGSFGKGVHYHHYSIVAQ